MYVAVRRYEGVSDPQSTTLSYAQERRGTRVLQGGRPFRLVQGRH